MKKLYTNRALAALYRDKIDELNWKITQDPEQADIVSFKTRGMLSNLETIENAKTIWGIPKAYHLVAKQNMWFYLRRFYGLKKAEYISPKTYILKSEEDKKELIAALEKGNKIILKTNQQRRKGLQIVDSISELEQKQSSEHVIGQILKTNTLKFKNRHFHLRFYVSLCINFGELSGWVHPKSRVVFSKARPNNSHEEFITSNDYFSEELPLFGFELVGKKLLSLNTFFRVQKLLRIAIKPFIQVLTSELKPQKGYFDLFGIDIIFLENQYPLLVEINRLPSMNTLNKKDEILKKEIISTFLNAIDQNKPDLKGWTQFF